MGIEHGEVCVLLKKQIICNKNKEGRTGFYADSILVTVIFKKIEVIIGKMSKFVEHFC